MSGLEIRSGQFPKAIPHHLAVGEEVRLTITARIYRIEEDQVDVTPFNGPYRVLGGERTTGLTILEIEEAP